MVIDVSVFSETTKGVPGFGQRLGILFDMANAPKDTRLTWGANRWKCAPNSVRNWLVKDLPPQKFTGLLAIVEDLLSFVPGKYDVNRVTGWLYTGTNNPFIDSSEATDHILQAKIYNRFYQMALFTGHELDSLPQDKLNKMISVIYWYLHFRKKYGMDSDIKIAASLMAHLLQKLIAELN
jgi:hypothetical protein